MIGADDQFDSGVRSSSDSQRVLRSRMGWIAATAASYALDAVFLGLFAAIGVIGGGIPVAYALCAAAICGASALAYRRGWNLKARDPNLTEPNMLLALVLQLAVVWHAPQIAFPFLCNVFTVFAFGMVSISVRDSVVIWGLVVAGTGTVMYAVADRLGMAVGSGAALTLTWLYFALVLGRFVLLSVYSAGLRARLRDSRRRLAATLDQVQRLIAYDELTRSLNRRSIVARLGEEKVRAERTGVTFSIAMMDLDHFKQVNDTHGHAAGDDVLRGFAGAVHGSMRATDAFGRYGGEEFLLVLTGSGAATARDAAERIRRAVQGRDWSATAQGLKVTVSVGIAAFRAGEAVDELLKRADEALYRAKGDGRDRIVIAEA